MDEPDELVWSMEVGDGEDDVNDTLPPQTHKKKIKKCDQG